ncbi:MAG: alpha-2-macroglobulin family protein [Planctomycetota bacterium]|jgi:CD109 antigen
MVRCKKTISVFFAVLALTLPVCTANADLVGHWKLDDISGNIAVDSSGQGRDGTLHGEPTWQPSGGRISGALEFDGINDYVTTDFVLDPGSGAFSAFAWIKGGDADQTIISQTYGPSYGGTGYEQKWLCLTSEGKLATLMYAGRLVAPLKSQIVITDEQWHHIGLVWDGSRRYLYVDGQEAAKDAEVLSGLRASDGGLYFGARRNLSESDFWFGLMDDIRIYDAALSTSQIEHLATQGGNPGGDPVSALVLAPKTMYTQTPAAVTVTAVNTADRSPAVVPVNIWFGAGSATTSRVFEGATDNGGRLTAKFDTPDIAPGAYTLEISIEGVENLLTAQVQVRQMPVLLIETDKPIYKPGQTIKGRVLVLTNELRPVSNEVNVEITDGKGVKIFREVLTANAFGVAPFELDLASELNFGTWKITAESGSASGIVDVRVEKYVLPRFDVDLITGKDYFLVDEEISGTVDANYFFGKPVDGSVEVRASRYVGVWEEYATYTTTLSDGSAEFILPAVGYVSGTSGAGGAGSAQLEVTVTDTSDHEEKTTKLLKIVESPIQHQIIALDESIIPGQPFDVLLVAETPDGDPVTVSAEVICKYYKYGDLISKETRVIPNFDGSTTVLFNAPANTSYAEIQSSVQANDATADAELLISATYSPSDSFLHMSRSSNAAVNVGDTITIDVFRTHDATVYYDVFANGHTVWSDATTDSQIVFQATQQMVPVAKVVAYIINPNNEISADTLQFEVILKDAAELDVHFNADEVLPGDEVQVSVQADAEAMVGLAIVDESVYALNEGRLNMQEVFKELERLFMEPQSETHEQSWIYGAYEIFEEAGRQVLTSGAINVPQGLSAWEQWWRFVDGPWLNPAGGGGGAGGGSGGGGGPPDENKGLAEVTRIRQFFPETWLWTPDLLTNPDGIATIDLTAPDSITTWRLHAVSTSDNGLGICESELLVFQEFFGEPDLPYAVTRGEQFPVRIQVFNYLDIPQVVFVKLTDADWFDLLETGKKEISVGANSVGLASFLIEPTKLGLNTLEVTLRSNLRADAVRKELLVEPEGTQRELVTNGMIRAGQTLTLDANMPDYRVPSSGKLLLSITPSLVAQSINGVDDLLHMPYGCGEQNMIFFAPDVEVLRYLDATGQLTPEVRAKAEHFITCGYQRELTYCRQDGSFSAFGDSDESGSLWLTAFVLGTFSAARDVQTVDETILADAANWIEDHQLPDGSWEPIGFVHHKEMIGGVTGNFTLTAFVTIALTDYGSAASDVMENAVQHLKDNLSSVQDDAYALAISALAFARLGDTEAANNTIARLLEIAISDGDGIHWEPHAIETTAYAALAMIEMENAQANNAIKWLALQQNSQGGFGSTQDTVMALKALLTAARAQTRNVNLTITAKKSDKSLLAQFTVDSNNFDVLQIAELPVGTDLELSATGSGEVRYQLVRRFNVFLADEIVQNNMALEVTYDANHVEIDDIVNVTATVRYLGMPGSSGMMIVDVGVPTGFTPVQESLDAIVEAGLVSKVEVAGRKVIFYVDELTGGEERSFTFQVKARFPVRAVIPDSKAYLYYEPEVRAEAPGKRITAGLFACIVDLDYLAEFSGHWLESGSDLAADLDNSGLVDFRDLEILSNNWLNVCP